MTKNVILKRKNVNVIIRCWYYLDGEYMRFMHNPLDGTEYTNVDITIQDHTRVYSGIAIKSQLINITGKEPINCEYINSNEIQTNKLIINICQDWG